MDNKLLKSLEQPKVLEDLYQENTDQFKTWLEEALEKLPKSATLKVWEARLNYVPQLIENVHTVSIWLVIALSLVTSLVIKILISTASSFVQFFPIFVYVLIPTVMFTALIIYFMFLREETSKLKKIQIGCALAFSIFFMLVLASLETPSQSIIMSMIYLPMVLVSLLGYVFMGERVKTSQAKLDYIRYWGEMFIYAIMIILGGMVLTLLFKALLQQAGITPRQTEKFILGYIVVFGLVSAPIVATYVYDSVLGRSSKFATILANIFAPLFLIAVLLYLIASLGQGKIPYSDRDSLITFNALLIVIWGITVFSISGTGAFSPSKLSHKVNFALLGVTLIINAIVLSSIVFRLFQYGITPNRLVVTGTNLVIFVHLVLILKAYFGYMFGQNSQRQLSNAIATYLPVYSIWSVFVVFVVPFLFWFH